MNSIGGLFKGLNQAWRILIPRVIAASEKAFPALTRPYRDDAIVGVEYICLPGIGSPIYVAAGTLKLFMVTP